MNRDLKKGFDIGELAKVIESGVYLFWKRTSSDSKNSVIYYY